MDNVTYSLLRKITINNLLHIGKALIFGKEYLLTEVY